MFTHVMRVIRMAVVVTATVSAAVHLNAAEPDHRAFDAFGGLDGLQRVADRGVDRVLADPRIKESFAHANIPRLKMQLAAQFCALLGGPCSYTGQPMKAAHAGMNVREAQFNALAEDFQLAMDDLKIPFTTQNALISKLAPMARAINENGAGE
jgi:hemoglobin